ncbi:hypothetical protein IW147_004321 [Coemansia sp. RSA 720]|nr:hypothetical protein IW147_004321 [Coemansia sp. RSA 720]
MDARYQNPFAAFWTQGIVPGQGFPQVGMSAYGYGLPGYGLQRFLSPDAQILAGVGEGEISGHDLKHMDDKVNGYDRFKDTGDPAYPGCFKSENCGSNGNVDNEYNQHNLGVSTVANAKCLIKLLATIALVGTFAA